MPTSRRAGETLPSGDVVVPLTAQDFALGSPGQDLIRVVGADDDCKVLLVEDGDHCPDTAQTHLP